MVYCYNHNAISLYFLHDASPAKYFCIAIRYVLILYSSGSSNIKVFRFIPVLYAITYWMRGQTKPFIICSGIAIIVFRSELALFLGLLLAVDLLKQKLSIDGYGN